MKGEVKEGPEQIAHTGLVRRLEVKTGKIPSLQTFLFYSIVTSFITHNLNDENYKNISNIPHEFSKPKATK